MSDDGFHYLCSYETIHEATTMCAADPCYDSLYD